MMNSRKIAVRSVIQRVKLQGLADIARLSSQFSSRMSVNPTQEKEKSRKLPQHFDLNYPVARSHPYLAGYSPLHLACRIPLLGVVADLTQSDLSEIICFDEYLQTPRDVAQQVYLSSRKTIIGAEKLAFLKRISKINYEQPSASMFEVPVESGFTGAYPTVPGYKGLRSSDGASQYYPDKGSGFGSRQEVRNGLPQVAQEGIHRVGTHVMRLPGGLPRFNLPSIPRKIVLGLDSSPGGVQSSTKTDLQLHIKRLSLDLDPNLEDIVSNFSKSPLVQSAKEAFNLLRTWDKLGAAGLLVSSFDQAKLRQFFYSCKKIELLKNTDLKNTSTALDYIKQALELITRLLAAGRKFPERESRIASNILQAVEISKQRPQINRLFLSLQQRLLDCYGALGGRLDWLLRDFIIKELVTTTGEDYGAGSEAEIAFPRAKFSLGQVSNPGKRMSVGARKKKAVLPDRTKELGLFESTTHPTIWRQISAQRMDLDLYLTTNLEKRAQLYEACSRDPRQMVIGQASDQASFPKNYLVASEGPADHRVVPEVKLQSRSGMRNLIRLTLTGHTSNHSNTSLMMALQDSPALQSHPLKKTLPHHFLPITKESPGGSIFNSNSQFHNQFVSNVDLHRTAPNFLQIPKESSFADQYSENSSKQGSTQEQRWRPSLSHARDKKLARSNVCIGKRPVAGVGIGVGMGGAVGVGARVAQSTADGRLVL